MKVRRIVPDISSTDLEATRDFYVDLVGLEVAMDLGFIVTLVSPSNVTAQLNILRAAEESRGEHPSTVAISIEVESVDDVHSRAVEAGLDIVYPLTTESFGVRRFHLRDPNGVLVNIMSHVISEP